MRAGDRFDSLALGLILGILVPVVTLLTIMLIRFPGELFIKLGQLQEINMVDSLISVSVLPNLLLFFLFIWKNRNFSARGVIFATLILAFIMLIFKVI